jgi:hypothetical protein
MAPPDQIAGRFCAQALGFALGSGVVVGAAPAVALAIPLTVALTVPAEIPSHAEALGAPARPFIAVAEGAALVTPIPITGAALGRAIAKTGARTFGPRAAIAAG